jgi:hypothetical protein
VAARRRRSPLTAASGSSQIAYQGKSQAVDKSSASVAHPAATRQSAPRRVRHKAYRRTTTNPAMKQCRHQPGVPPSPTRRAVSAGTLCVATSCCCSLTALRNPSACEPKPISPTAASSARLNTAAAATRRRSFLSVPPAPSTRNGSARPAVTLTPTPAASAAAPARKRRLEPAVNTSAAARASRRSVSLWAPPTASSSSTGLRPTNAAA